MDLNQNEILSQMQMQIKQVQKTMLAMENKIQTFEQKMEEQLEANLQKIGSKFESHCNAIIYSKASHHEKQTPISHQLAESVSGIIGLKESITTKHPVLKYTWMFLFCLGIGATIFFIYATANEFFDEPTLTKIRVLPNETYAFPPIVLCKYEWFDTEKATKLGLSIDALKYSLGYADVANFSFSFDNISKARENFLDIFAKHKFSSIIDYYKAIAVDLEPVTSVEVFSNSTSPSYMANKVKAEKTYMTMSSICYSFSLPPIEKRWESLYSNYDDPVTIKFADKTAGVIGSASIYWLLYLSKDKDPENSWSLMIKSSTTTSLSINVEKFIAFDDPDAPCVSADYKNGNYSSETCVADCTNRINQEILGCQLLSLSNENSRIELSEYCNIFDARSDNFSLLEVQRNTSLERGNQIGETCYKECPPKCERLLYEATMRGESPFLGIYTSLPTSAIHPNMSVTEIEITNGAIKRGGIVTYEELSNYSYIALVSNIGGTLGLFIGGTLLTLAQLVLFFVGYICDKKQKTTKVQVLSQ